MNDRKARFFATDNQGIIDRKTDDDHHRNSKIPRRETDANSTDKAEKVEWVTTKRIWPFTDQGIVFVAGDIKRTPQATKSADSRQAAAEGEKELAEQRRLIVTLAKNGKNGNAEGIKPGQTDPQTFKKGSSGVSHDLFLSFPKNEMS
jgi:hypothetical protein